MVAQVAALLPDTAAKMAQPTTFTCNRRPGSDCIHGARPRNMSCDKRVRKRISPIHTKSGSAVSVQLLLLPQMVTAMASPAGLLLNNCMAIQATPLSVRPIHTPLARMRNSAPMSRKVMLRSDMAAAHSLRDAMSPVARRPRSSSTSSSRKAMASTVVPMTMLNCGIHSGVASVPVDTSLKLWDCHTRRPL